MRGGMGPLQAPPLSPPAIAAVLVTGSDGGRGGGGSSGKSSQGAPDSGRTAWWGSPILIQISWRGGAHAYAPFVSAVPLVLLAMPPAIL